MTMIKNDSDEPIIRKDIFGVPTYSKKSRQIADQFSPENRQFVLMVLKSILSLVDFSADGTVAYSLQFPSGHPHLIKERRLLEKFEQQGLFKNQGEDGIWGIATLNGLDIKLIKEVIGRLEQSEAGIVTSDEFEDKKKRYNKTVQGIRQSNRQSNLQQRYNKLLNDVSPHTQGTTFNADDKVLECGLIKINLSQSTIQYQDTPPKEVSIGNNTIKFLILLMKNKRVVEYTEIAQELELNCYHEGVKNKDVAREVQFLRRDLGGFLVKIGMNRTEVQSMFISIKNVGYKLRCGG